MAMSYKERLESVVLGCFGSVLSVVFLSVGALVMAWLAGQSAYFNGIPLYKAILTGAEIFFILALALFLISTAIARYRQAKTELNGKRKGNTNESRPDGTRPATEQVEALQGRIKELEREKATLEITRRRDDETLQMCISSRDEKLESYKWLDEIAERDKKKIVNLVLLESCEMKSFDLEPASIPFIELEFTLFNASVFTISIQDAFTGRILYRNIPLAGDLRMMENHAKDLRHGAKNVFKIRQQLTREACEFMNNATKTAAPHSEQAYVDVSGIEISYTVTTPAGEAVREPVRLPLIQKVGLPLIQR